MTESYDFINFFFEGFFTMDDCNVTNHKKPFTLIPLSRENLAARRAQVLEKLAAALASARVRPATQRACSITRRITESTVVVFSVLSVFFSARRS